MGVSSKLPKPSFKPTVKRFPRAPVYTNTHVPELSSKWISRLYANSQHGQFLGPRRQAVLRLRGECLLAGMPPLQTLMLPEVASSTKRLISRLFRSIMLPRLLTQRSASALPPVTHVTMLLSTSATSTNLQHQPNSVTALLHLAGIAVTAWFARIVRMSWILTHLTQTSSLSTIASIFLAESTMDRATA